jgi:hypothetical protein
VIAFAQKTLRDGNIISKLHVIELGGAAPGGAVKRNAELFFPPEFADDFPVSLQVCSAAWWQPACFWTEHHAVSSKAAV